MFGHLDPVEPGSGQELDDDAPEERERSDCEAHQVLVKAKGDSAEWSSTVLDGADLDNPHEDVY